MNYKLLNVLLTLSVFCGSMKPAEGGGNPIYEASGFDSSQLKSTKERKLYLKWLDQKASEKAQRLIQKCGSFEKWKTAKQELFDEMYKRIAIRLDRLITQVRANPHYNRLWIKEKKELESKLPGLKIPNNFHSREDLYPGVPLAVVLEKAIIMINNTIENDPRAKDKTLESLIKELPLPLKILPVNFLLDILIEKAPQKYQKELQLTVEKLKETIPHYMDKSINDIMTMIPKDLYKKTIYQLFLEDILPHIITLDIADELDEWYTNLSSSTDKDIIVISVNPTLLHNPLFDKVTIENACALPTAKGHGLLLPKTKQSMPFGVSIHEEGHIMCGHTPFVALLINNVVPYGQIKDCIDKLSQLQEHEADFYACTHSKKALEGMISFIQKHFITNGDNHVDDLTTHPKLSERYFNAKVAEYMYEQPTAQEVPPQKKSLLERLYEFNPFKSKL